MNAPVGDLADLLNDFAEEAISSLQGLPAHFEDFRRRPDNVEPINAVFRVVHSIKGNASFFGLVEIKTFTHYVENTLDEIRKLNITLTADLQAELVAAFDHIDGLINQAVAGEHAAESSPRSQELLAAIGKLTEVKPSAPSRTDELAAFLQALQFCEVPGMETPVEWLASIFEHGMDQLAGLVSGGESNSAADPSVASGAKAITPSQLADARWSVLGVELAERVSAVLDLFLAFERGQYQRDVADRFVLQCRALATWARQSEREPLAVALETSAQHCESIANSPLDLDAGLLGLLWDGLWPHLSALIDSQAALATVALTAAEPQAPLPATGKSAPTTAHPEANNRSVRVKEERLDEFLDRVARLFITGEMLKDLQARMVETKQMRPQVEELRQIIRSFTEQASALQKSLFALRRVAVAGMFSKFPRMVRTLASQLEKKIDIQLVGEDVELDKALLEDLDAPLTHLLRNAVDHGIDLPGDRLARGVAETGRVTLCAEVTRTHVRVIVQDDGRGIDPAVLRRKVVEKGLHTHEQASALSDDEAIQLIFHPGFSTAEKLSEISGRGVGLDVVRTSIRKHNGDVSVSSRLGVGTTFTLEVPLREAVIVVDGLLMRQAGEHFVIPFEHIREITQIEWTSLSSVHGSYVARIRDQVYDAKTLSSILNLPSAFGERNTQVTAVLVRGPKGDLCLLVDEVLGNRKVVVNSVSELLPEATRIAGVSQLGGGRLALVLSVPEICNSLTACAAQ